MSAYRTRPLQMTIVESLIVQNTSPSQIFHVTKSSPVTRSGRGGRLQYASGEVTSGIRREVVHSTAQSLEVEGGLPNMRAGHVAMDRLHPPSRCTTLLVLRPGSTHCSSALALHIVSTTALALDSHLHEPFHSEPLPCPAPPEFVVVGSSAQLSSALLCPAIHFTALQFVLHVNVYLLGGSSSVQ